MREKGPFKIVHEESEFIDAQKLRVQESPDDLRGGEQPQTLDVDVDDDLAGVVARATRSLFQGYCVPSRERPSREKALFLILYLTVYLSR